MPALKLAFDEMQCAITFETVSAILGNCNSICVKLLQLMRTVITHNSVKQNEVSILALWTSN